jgi:hypothetical protein
MFEFTQRYAAKNVHYFLTDKFTPFHKLLTKERLNLSQKAQSNDHGDNLHFYIFLVHLFCRLNNLLYHCGTIYHHATV